jgi:hypothetical protein
MQSATKDKTYKSPVRKLARFFEQSRDQWKAKCREAKALVKRLKHRIRCLEESRTRWKSRAQALTAEVARLQAQQQALESELERLRQARTEEPTAVGGLENFALVPRHHQYSVGHVQLFVALVLSDAASLRCAGRAMETFLSFLRLPRPGPAWSAGRLWLLRLGYYKLTRPKERADDWVWLVDHSVQLGDDKVFVILGVRLADLLPAGQCLSHSNVEPLAILPVKHSNQDIVYQQLEATLEKTGVPREIISDHGSDLKSGVERFCQAHPETCAIYDIKHKTAAVLKHALQPDEAWQAFTRLAAQTKQQVQQTALAPLAPPHQRTKARYMNVADLIQWGHTLLTWLDQPPGDASLLFDSAHVQAKLGWVSEFRQALGEWDALLQVITTTESFVRQQGLYRGAHTELQARLQGLAHTERAKQVCTELVTFVAAEEAKAQPDERLLGSSEVIESVFGKLKRLEQDQAKSGFTGLLLSVGAMVSTTTAEVIQKALETVPTKTVLAWCKEHLGPSVQAKRKAAFAFPGQTEQKWDQLCEAT